jgi:histone-lysine N-methyltransferase SETMAR
MKKILITFFDVKGIVHFEFTTQGQTVNEVYYMEIFERLYEAMRREGPELQPNDWIPHHDNALAHKALSVKIFVAQKFITEMEQSPCSPDLAPYDFWLFPKINSALKG